MKSHSSDLPSAVDWSYGGSGSASFWAPLPLNPMVEERVRRAFDLEAQIKVCAEELHEIFFVRRLPEKPPRHRDRYHAALVLLANYMNQVGFPGHITAEIVELCQSLKDLDEGIVRHFLKPATVTTRPRDPTDIWCARSFVSAAIQRLIESGRTRRAACKLISHEYGDLAHILAPTSKQNFHTVIEGWHRQFSERDRISRPGRIPTREQELFDDIIKSTSFDIDELMRTAQLLAARASTPASIERLRQARRTVRKAPLKSL